MAVPSAPRRLQLSLIEEDPPVVHLSWQAPLFVHGTLTGYRLIYHVKDDDDDDPERRRFEADKHQFTTTFLGMTVRHLGRLSLLPSEMWWLGGRALDLRLTG